MLSRTVIRSATDRRACLGGAVAVLGLMALSGGPVLTPHQAGASSHREAPLIAGDPLVDNTDVYAFVSPDADDTVTLIANWLPFQEPNGGPNFYTFQAGANYDVHIDNNGDAEPDITYRWVFNDVDDRGNDTFLYNNGPVTSLDDENLLFRQTYTLTEIKGGESRELVTDAVAAPSRVGKASMPNYAKLRQEAVTETEDGGMTFAGQADDSFFLDLRVFDLLYGGDLSKRGQDTLAGYNVQTIALQVPKDDLALDGDASSNPVIGVWSTTSKKSMELSPGKAESTGDQVQVSRLGNPLINEVIAPAGLKDAFNGSTPAQDSKNEALVGRVTDPEVPKLLQAIYNLPPPKAPRNDLVEIFLTGIAKKAPTLDGSEPPIQADLNAHVLNKGVDPKKFVPSEQLRLNMSVPVADNPNRLGVLAMDLQGFPNGRRLIDDVVDIELQALAGAAQTGKIVPALAAGDQVNVNDRAFGENFPYLALPHASAVNRSGGGMPVGGASAGAGGTYGGGWRLPVAGALGVVVLFGAGLLLRRRQPRPRAAGQRVDGS